MKKQVFTYEDIKMMHPEYPYVIATVNDIPLWLCKTQDEALREREDEMKSSAIMLKVVDVRLL